MDAEIFNITLQKGLNFSQTFHLANNDKTNTPVILTGYTAKMIVQKSIDYVFAEDEEPLTLTTENDGISIDPLDGSVTVIITSDQIDDITFSRGYYELFMMIDTYTTRILKGTVKVEKGLQP